MLKSKKHQVLRIKRRKTETENKDDENIKTQMFKLKKELLQKEDERNEIQHQLRLKREEELHSLIIENQKLQNEKLQLEIKIAKRELKITE